jgi:hypothetical protein
VESDYFEGWLGSLLITWSSSQSRDGIIFFEEVRDMKVFVIRVHHGLPRGFFNQPTPVPAKTHARDHGCRFPTLMGDGFHTG